MSVRIKLLHPNATVPKQSTPGSVGVDLWACLDRDVIIEPDECKLIPTGVAIALNPGPVGMVCPRSGLAFKNQVTVLNAPGIIDESYRGEVGVILFNHGFSPYVVNHGGRIAQLVIVPYITAEFSVVGELDQTERGSGGFGSTGV